MKKLAIQHVSIKNYGTFSQLEMSLHPDMTVIIGDNNAGKTSLFKAFCLIMWGYMAPLIEKEYSRPKHLKISLKDLNNKKKYKQRSRNQQ